jgi:hypothetical protein
VYGYIGSFNSRKCVSLYLTAPATLYEFMSTVLPACCAAVSSVTNITLTVTAYTAADDDSDNDNDDEDAEGPGGSTTDEFSEHEVMELIAELYYQTRGKVDRVEKLLTQ